jgi:hypothetical protein
MKTKLNLFLYASVLFLYLMASAVNSGFPESANMLQNGDFSSGTMGWILTSNSGGKAAFSVKRGELHISITSGGDYTYSILLNQSGLKIVKGVSYAVSFNARSESGNRNLYVKVGLVGEPWTLYSDFKTYVLTKQKTSYSFMFTMLEPTDTNAYLEFQLGQSDIDVYLDDIVLKQIDDSEVIHVIKGAKLPPTGKVTREYPRLINYLHQSSFENKVLYREERLAQWDVLIISPEIIQYEKLSLAKMRKIHSDIKILVWIPFGQEPWYMDIAKAIPKENDPHNWFGKTVKGDYIFFPWGGHLMNPYKYDFAYPKHMISFIKKYYLDSGLYDGVMFDVLLEGVPTFLSKDNPQTFDTDEDGRFTKDDNKKYIDGVLYLLENLRKQCPKAIITGNGGNPWSKECAYLGYANGSMHENALGNEFGTYYWFADYGALYPKDQPWLKGVYGTWDGYRSYLDGANPNNLKRYFFINVDVRMDRTQEQAENLQQLTADDLRRMRLGLCTSLLEDGGYFGFDRGDCLHGQLWWFDEYDADLGNPVEVYKRGMYGEGNNKKEVYSRRFEKGMVIVNNNSTNTSVKLEGTYRDVTTKEEGTVFTIPPNDARIYLKK